MKDFCVTGSCERALRAKVVCETILAGKGSA